MIEDPALEERLRSVAVRKRRVLPVALACLCATLLIFAVIEPTMGRYWLALFGSVVALISTLGFAKERRIVAKLSAGSATVTAFRKVRRGSKIRYAFKANDNKVYLGRASGGPFLPKEGRTLGVAYNVDDPARNLPFSQFWFYEFTFATTVKFTEQNELARN